MEITTRKRGDYWVVEFGHGVQSFRLDYQVKEKERAEWMKGQLIQFFESAQAKKPATDTGQSNIANNEAKCTRNFPECGHNHCTPKYCIDYIKPIEVKLCVKNYAIGFGNCLDCDLANKCKDKTEY